MTASPGELKPTLWHWQTDDYVAELLFRLLKLELCARFVQRCLCNPGSPQTLQPATLAAFFLLAASRNIPCREQSGFFAFAALVLYCCLSHRLRSRLGVESSAGFICA
jgi:hypothetical protein